MSLIKFTSNSKVKILDKTIFSTSLNGGGGGEGGGGPSYGPFWSGWSTEPTYTSGPANGEGVDWTVSGNTLDVSPRTALTSFSSAYSYAGGSGVIDARGCTNLTSLNCYYSDITSVNVSGCSSLGILLCSGNYNITSVNIDGCIGLHNVSIWGITISAAFAEYILWTLDSFGTDNTSIGRTLLLSYGITGDTDISILTAKANLESKGWVVYTM